MKVGDQEVMHMLTMKSAASGSVWIIRRTPALHVRWHGGVNVTCKHMQVRAHQMTSMRM